MTRVPDLETRSIMALSRETSRMRDAAERVDLVVKAIALRRGVKPEPYYETDDMESAIVK